MRPRIKKNTASSGEERQREKRFRPDNAGHSGKPGAGRSGRKPVHKTSARPVSKPAAIPAIPGTRQVRNAAATGDGSVRLNKFIANAGLCSRREADEYIQAGLVSVNGSTVTELGIKVFPEKDEIRFNGERIKGEKKVYIVMNKPKDFVTTTKDPHAERNVMQLISKELCPERVFPVGRLDKATTGVLLLTNDGELAEKLTHPSFQKKKIYQVELDKNLKSGDMEKLTSGIQLEDGPAYADEVAYVDGEKSVVGVEIHSGRNRIIRRMFEALGYKVKKLDRVYFAGLTKKKLSRGQWRFLSDEEITMLKMNFYE